MARAGQACVDGRRLGAPRRSDRRKCGPFWLDRRARGDGHRLRNRGWPQDGHVWRTCASRGERLHRGRVGGVVRIWPVRYSLQLLDGLPKPFVSAPESRPFAGDSAGRLTSYAGKIEIQCPKQTERTAVILIAGQSNAANSAAQRHNTRYPDRVLNFAGGRCYIAASPLLGSTGFAGEYWTLMADELIDTGAFDHIILSPVAVGASSIAQWAQGGALNAPDDSPPAGPQRSLPGHTRSLASGRVRFRPQDRSGPIQGAASCHLLRPCGPMGLTRRSSFQLRPVAYRVGRENAIQSAQQELASSQPGFKPGVDTDEFLEPQDRYDDCHFADSGEVKTARAWAAILAQRL